MSQELHIGIGKTTGMFGIRQETALRAIVLFLLLTIPAFAQEIGTVTFLEGPLRMIRGASVLRAPEGARLHSGDILESGVRGFVQLELPGGAVLAMGPTTRLFFLSRTEPVLLSGWLKAEIGPKAGAYRIAVPRLGAATHDGTVVLQTASDATSLFVESGTATISDVSADGYWSAPRNTKAGQFFSRRGGRDVSMAGRPDPAFVQEMPRAFQDTLPSRISKFASRRAEPQRDHEVTYADIQPWLTTSRSWRRSFVERFQSRLKDPDFRQAVDAHMNQHPEWDPVLHPEKYQPEGEPADAKNPSPQSRR